MKKLMFLAVAAVALMCSCNSNKFKVSGTVEGAGDTTTLFLETNINGNWLFVDSVVTSGDKFAFTEDAAEYPNIYRLGCRGKDAIYFPIDSVDNIEIKTSIAKFAEDYTLSGSDNAVKMMNIDKQAAKFSKAGDTSSAAYVKWKDELSRDLVKDPAGIVAFYLINKYIGDKPLFDPLDKKDFKIIGAVTNAFANFRPNDPRTSYMVDNFKVGLSQRRSESAPRDTLVATEASLIDIKLMDQHGKMQSLQEVSSHGKVVVLNFTMMNQSFSPALNKLLNSVYTKHKASGLEIFQVCLDSDEAEWMQSVASLPWIAMRDPNGEYSQYASAYNITQLPTVFIIGRNGEIVERVGNVEQLETAVAKHL
ncbi:MAG: TlpA disulfide reductase family protein [Bacteroidales bacterium]|nr:AhpC/TSA family protein [Muribaculaceae bacterium]MDY6292631.1 TlpA disulfide reductase family protein [Bacteroidales bacterium]MDY6412577.1 TlpA disulfide reductase family protein [Bacteroidales bacterium]